jgi:uncharacterized membrane protein
MLGISEFWYELLKSVHVLSAIAWVGGGIFVQIYVTRLSRADQPERLAGFARDLEVLGNRVFAPASILVLIMGLLMVFLTDGLHITDLWIILGLVGIANTIVIGIVFLGPEAGRLGRMLAERDPSDAELQQRIARIFTISRIDLAVLLAVVVIMVFKPGA